MSGHSGAPRSGKPPTGGPTKHTPVPTKHAPIPTEWRIELPEAGEDRPRGGGDAEFGGCRSIDAGYKRGPVLGQGTYGEVSWQQQ